MRILLIEDDKKIASFMINGFKEAGFTVDHCDNGAYGYHYLIDNPYDAAVVDILLPEMNGYEIVEQARNKNINTPILFLSAKREIDDRVKGLRVGGDDYLVKPFSFTELLERIRALVRRSTGQTDATTLEIGDVNLDRSKHIVTRNGQRIDLNNREFTLLEYLMRNKGRVVSRTMIMDQVWDYYFDPQTNVVEATMCRMRGKLNDGHNERLIKTIRGVGYVFEDPQSNV
ncbi:MAG: response regulator transcription factor [Candidatus Hinthialibacter antarcticus]|nr:response regulator transcription factor [Candidatus Hinthialibacter antarcticus]